MTEKNTAQSKTKTPPPVPTPKAQAPTRTPQWMRDIAMTSETVGTSTVNPKLPNQVIMPTTSKPPITTVRQSEKYEMSQQEVNEFLEKKAAVKEKSKEVLNRLLDHDRQAEEDKKVLEKIENDMKAEEDKIDQLMKSKFS